MVMRPPQGGHDGPAPVTVMVVGTGEEVVAVVRSALGSMAQVLPTPVPYNEAESVAWVERPRVVIVGLERNLEKALELGPLLMDTLPGLHLVATASSEDPSRIRAAMRAGFREYVVLPDDMEILRRAIAETARGGTVVEDEERGRVIAICGAKGGAGVTFLAANLAAEMAATQRVYVVDLVYWMGDMAVLLDLKPSAGMSDVVQNMLHLDQRLLEACALTHSSRAMVLPQPDDLQAYEPPPVDAVLRVLHAAARGFPFVIVDCGIGADEQTLAAVVTAEDVLLVTTPEVPALRNAWRRLKLFDRLGVERRKIRLVLNRWYRGAPVSRKDIEGNLGIPIDTVLPDEPKIALDAVNYGRLLKDVSRRASLTKEVAALAARLVTPTVGDLSTRK